MSDISNLRDSINYDIFSFTDLLSGLPSTFDENSSIYPILNDICIKFDSILYNKIINLQFSRNPYLLDRSSLILLAQDLGFNWPKIELIQSEKFPSIIEYLPKFYRECKIGSVCMVTNSTETLTSSQVEPYSLGELSIGNTSILEPIYLQTNDDKYIEVTGVTNYNSINDSGIVNNKLSNFISYITGNTIIIEPLWTKDFSNFYTIEEAGSLMTPKKSRLDWSDTIYSSSEVTVTQKDLVGGPWYFTPFVRVTLDQLPDGFSVLDTLDLVYYFCPVTLVIQKTITESIGQFQFQTYCVSNDDITYSGFYKQPGHQNVN